ncbi:uncharacterized protein CANTADRAFT_299426 [Suhomyces tanzawaensis NRRL Y-17324]|uniref:Uncharacterized protein n=1 Tax=Suhomyces tanzawaensis NRRL Y-17324 TaxID=984487 RepID=A0A1E4SFP2_9ASCO|nr:uncharacterized protein CANTADRAFT_299426 [Suhomyces tanzawaensis NRRL Y-17324]ODV78222.1 hypothetical protein CANTADRAFT_299426 [Suhomyces tanzawaensis NRRL Y-17324]
MSSVKVSSCRSMYTRDTAGYNGGARVMIIEPCGQDGHSLPLDSRLHNTHIFMIFGGMPHLVYLETDLPVRAIRAGESPYCASWTVAAILTINRKTIFPCILKLAKTSLPGSCSIVADNKTNKAPKAPKIRLQSSFIDEVVGCHS